MRMENHIMKQKFTRERTESSDIFRFTIHKEMKLRPFLFEAMPRRSKNSVKSMLARGQVQVNNQIVTKHNHIIYPGQTVEILKNRAAKRESSLIGLRILFEDDDLIVVDKDAGLLSIATAKEKERTAHYQLMEYVRRQHPANRIFVVHRLDKDTSGVMMFAKNERAKHVLQNAWRDMVKERSYVALVEGEVNDQEGTITSWLKETKTRLMYSSPTEGDGLRADTHFKKIQANNSYTLLDVELETGRKNQIRVHMQDIGHPIVGDKKYGSKKKGIGRLGLHARALAFTHPKTKEIMRFEVDAPDIFYNKTGGRRA